MSRQELKQKGFTIIEVVLVLAIAALIFLMVFIALPALNRNARDQSRKTVQGKVVSAIGTYATNHRNQQYTNVTDLAPYLDVTQPGSAGNTLDNVDGYTLEGANSFSAEAVTQDKITLIKGSKCNTNGDGVAPGSSRNVAVLIRMENANAIVCQAS